MSFRGSIPRPIRSLSTLRRRGHPRTTQDSLPTGGQPLSGRLRTCRVPTKGFDHVDRMTSSLPKLLAAITPDKSATVLGSASEAIAMLATARARLDGERRRTSRGGPTALHLDALLPRGEDLVAR